MKNNLHVFLGATVADAITRPLHWIYNQKKLLKYVNGLKDFTFLKKNRSPFYNIKQEMFLVIMMSDKLCSIP